ncbi:MAG: TonB-dependent receptor [Atribacterota bacterium]|nr:TonB-dependent receptor [Atribacterota bacterium]MDD4895234.1 TonB-dependent receptor [Atribacterota bacterium]MDD5637004.1 TonB-dependent receptor [Atribacterota bacterium]
MSKKFYFILIALLIFVNIPLLCTNIFATELQDSLFTLEEIVVIASKYPQELLTSIASVEIINKKDIEISKSENLSGIIKNIAGLEITDYGSPGDIKSVSIRGSSPEQVLIMIDGKVVNDPQTGKIDLGLIPVGMIEKIEIYRGPASALYGANALGGVINIITQGGGEEKKGTAGVYFGSYHTQKYQASYQNRSNDFDYFFTGEYYQTEGDRENSQLDKISLLGKISKEIDQKTDLDLSIRYHDYQRGLPGSLDYPTPNAQQNDRNFNLNLKWQKREENKDINIIAWYDFHRLYYNNPDEWEHTGASIHKTYTAGLSFDSTHYNFSFDDDHIESDHTLTWGGDIKYHWIDSTDIGKQQDLNSAVFIQDVWQPAELEKLSITAGVRYDYHQIFGGQFNPRVGISYRLQDELSFHASVGRAYRAPTYDDLYWPEDGYVGGNPDLLPEIAWAYEAGLRFINEKGDAQAELNVFQKNVNDLINWTADPDGVWRPSNIGSARIVGTEVILKREFNDHFIGNLNYTYVNATDLDTGNPLKPRHKYGLGLAYLNQFGVNKDDFTIGLNGYIVTGRPDNLDNYYLFEANIDRDFTVNKEKDQKIKLSLSIKNLFDQRPELVSGYPVQGRTFLLGISADF